MKQGLAPEEISDSVVIPLKPQNLAASGAARAQRFIRRSAAALRQWATPSSNPFLQRAIRTESRKHKPFLTLLGVGIFACTLNATAWWLWLLFIDNNRRLGGRFGNLTDPMRLPEAIGGNPFGLIALLTATASAFGVLWAARARLAFLLRQELLKSTLDGLHQLPIAEERWLWMMSAHPTALSLVIGSMGLPIYAIMWWIGQWSLLDIIGLLMLFGIMGHGAPLWKPMLWQQQHVRKSNNFNWKQWQEVLKQAQQEAKRAGADKSVDALERQRRIQRALSGVADGSSGYSTEATPDKPAEKTKPETASDAGSNPASTTGVLQVSAGGSNTGSGFMLWILLQAFIMSVGPIMRLSGGGAGPLMQQLYDALPAGIMSLLPGFVITWPLILVRLLFSPLPFFGFALPPILLLLPLWAGFTHQNFTSLAANVSPVETFWTRSRLRLRRAIGAALWLTILLFLSGYGWPIVVAGGELAYLLPGAPLTPDWAVATVWTLAIISGTLLSGSAIAGYFKHAAAGNISPADAWREAARAVVMRMGGAIGLYFIFCWMGGLSGINAAWAQRALPTLAIAATFLLAAFGSVARGATLPKLARIGWNSLRFLWFTGLGLAALYVLLRSRITGEPFPHESVAPVFLSPYVTLFSLFRMDLTAPAEIWPCVAAQALIGVLLIAIAAREVFASKQPLVSNTADGAPGWTTQLLTLLSFPFRMAFGVFRTIALAVAKAFQRLEQLLQKWNDVILRWGMSYDNAVFTAELRRRLRREYWPAQWLLVCLALVGLFCLVILDALTYSGGFSWQDAAQSGTISGLIAIWGFSCLASSGLGQAFDRERLNGTTIFLFLTPMTDAAILAGKLVPRLVYTSGFLICAFVGLMFCSTVALFTGLAATVATGFCGALAVISVWCFAACVQLLFGVRAVKPTEGTAKAILCLVPVEAFSWLILSICDNSGDWWVVGGLCFLTLLHFALAYACWNLALWSLRRQRYGDVTAGGKMAS